MEIKYNQSNKYTLEMAIRLSLQRALLCEISANLRMVSAECNNIKNEIAIYFYFDGEPSLPEQESAACVSAEVSGDFDEDVQVSVKCLRLDSPEKLPNCPVIVYCRKE